ncbi:NUDIX hydrolase [Marinitenerispora sediminis]|uniref:NUDIX hydrolase n=1 Tax=Marinitenerispora sediminis TaxID=1931232 RepID=A0A368T319_9ACTN|nr:NUDIX hydrolase [Marinitenerispora sediminis]RCV52188.1 NUDIX hydrolase [Marinitenerispora sediminis]RCV53095.1 NUDIX hydrolase [Marinitenerispora sediminis]RCV56230.1 NUDIX hydrolase [Marinitenerispora sediminis]
MHSVSVAAAIVDPDGRLLTVQRADNGHWEPPGGVLELGESIEDGLRREVLEETGLHVGIDALTGVYKNIKLGVVALVFRCHPTGGRLCLSGETTAVEWVTPDEGRSRMAPAYAVRLLDAIASGPPQVRTHDGHDLVG